jgi:hypothetical protein
MSCDDRLAERDLAIIVKDPNGLHAIGLPCRRKSWFDASQQDSQIHDSISDLEGITAFHGDV